MVEEPADKPTADDARLVGRSDERATIAAVARSGGALLIRGERGIGLTALLDDARAALPDGATVLRAAGTAAESGLPYAGLHQLLAGIPERLELPAAADAPEAQFAVAERLLDLLEGMAAAAPVAILVDDAQLLDAPSCGVLGFVGRRVAKLRVGVVVAAHGTNPVLDALGLPERQVDRLDAESARSLIATLAPDLTTPWRERILDDAQGLPLALTEVAQAVTSDPQLAAGIPPVTLAPTPRLREALRPDIDVDSAAAAVLLAAALDPDAPLAELLAAAGEVRAEPVGVGDLSEAVSGGVVVVRGERLDFERPIFRSIALATASLDEVQRTHAALAEIARDGDRRVMHRTHGVVEPDAGLADEVEAAAATAYRRGHPTRAAQAFVRAAELSASDDDRARRLTLAAALAFELGLPDYARRLLTLVDQLDVSALERTRAGWQRSVVDATMWSPERTVRSFVDMAEVFEGAGQREYALRALVPVALKCWWSTSSPGTRAALAATGDRLAEDASDPARLAVMALADGDATGAEVLAHIARLRPHDLADPMHGVYVAMAAEGVGAWRAATVFLEPAIADLRAQRRAGTLTRALAYNAWAALHTGDWATATEDAEEANALASGTAQPQYLVLGELIGLQVAALRGVESDLESRIARAERTLLALKAHSMLATTHLARGSSALSDGRNDAAYEHVRPIFDPSEMPFHASVRTWAVLDLVEAGVHSGHADEVRGIADGLEPLAERLPGTLLGAALACARPLLADDDEADDLFVAALSTDLAGWPYLRARTLLSQGSWLRRRRRVAESRRPLRGARDLFELLGARRWAERAASELRATGESTGPRSEYDRDRLTAQEVQIARLAADGMSNREIGERLFLSHRTVGSHLYRIFPKLGITSRSQLREALDTAPT